MTSLPWRPTPPMRDLVRMAAWRMVEPSANELRARRAQALRDSLAADPAAQVSWAIADLGRDDERCAHLSTAAVLLAAFERDAAAGQQERPLPFDPLLPSVSTFALDQPIASELDDAQYGHVHAWGDHLIVLSHAKGDTILSCYDRERRTLCWRTRWSSAEDAPSRALTLRDGCAVVAEGISRLIVVDLASGSVRERLGSASLPLDPSQVCIAGATVVIPSPLADAILVAHAGSADPLDEYPSTAADASTRRVALPQAIRWLVPLPPFAAVLVNLGGQRALGFDGGSAYPLGKPLGVPAPFLADAKAPASLWYGVVGERSAFAYNLDPTAPH